MFFLLLLDIGKKEKVNKNICTVKRNINSLYKKKDIYHTQKKRSGSKIFDMHVYKEN